MRSTLTDIALRENTDKANPHWYTSKYERYFGFFRDQPITLVEIGVASGASLRMWDKYFTHPATQIHGIDIVPETEIGTVSDRVHLWIGDGTKETFGIESPNFIIDDGSHVAIDINTALNLWWPKLKSKGVYVIEDLAVQYRRDYGGGPTGSIVTNVMEGHVSALMRGGSGSDVRGIGFYDEIVFLDKA